MNISLKTLQQQDSRKILEIVMPIIDKLYKKVDYIGLTKDKYYELVLNEIEKSKRMYKGDVSYTEYIKRQVSLLLSEKVKLCFLEAENTIIAISIQPIYMVHWLNCPDTSSMLIILYR